MFKVNNRKTRARCEMCSTFTMEQVKAGWKKIKKRNNPLIIIKFPKELAKKRIT